MKLDFDAENERRPIVHWLLTNIQNDFFHAWFKDKYFLK